MRRANSLQQTSHEPQQGRQTATLPWPPLRCSPGSSEEKSAPASEEEQEKGAIKHHLSLFHRTINAARTQAAPRVPWPVQLGTNKETNYTALRAADSSNLCTHTRAHTHGFTCADAVVVADGREPDRYRGALEQAIGSRVGPHPDFCVGSRQSAKCSSGCWPPLGLIRRAQSWPS